MGLDHNHNSEDKKNSLLPSGKLRINYLYFGFFFLGIALVHVFHIFLFDNVSLLTRSYYLLYTLGQCFLEVLILVLFFSFVQSFLPRWCSFLFVVFAFFLFLAHVVDFPLVRIMDWSIWYVFHFITQESWENFVEMLYASHVSLLSWLIGFVVSGVLLYIGFMLFRFSEKVAEKKPLILARRQIISLLCGVPLLLVCCEQGVKQFSPASLSDQMAKTLPWKITFVPTSREFVLVSNPLKEPGENKEVVKRMSSTALKRKPNMFLFVMESLREDFITAEIAPNLHQFKKDNIAFDHAFSNANATQISWFSLFYSKLPLYWGKITPAVFKDGAPPLLMLKNLGYKIHVYSSVRLAYYQMDELIFGKDKYLVQDVHLFPHDDEVQAFQSDASTINKLCEDVKAYEKEEGHLFIVFLESTHFHYSFPNDKELKFTPVIEEINYLKAACSMTDLEAIKNRYRNALYYTDSLFGQFMATLKTTPHEQKAVVVVTGDHGEEFYEKGHLFHASALSTVQTLVPLYYKLGTNKVLSSKKCCTLTSHMDIFPTLLHYIAGEEIYEGILDGESIFKENKWLFSVVARYNASRTPTEFFIHNGQEKLLCKFSDERDIYNCQKLHILSYRDSNDDPMPFHSTVVEEKFQDAFDKIFAP
jgi:glucan phosphoethanolaminetransferase (alkaline phosphatase superfamily)